MSSRKNTWLLLAAILLIAPPAYADARHDKMRGNDANAAARTTKIVTAADAPRPILEPTITPLVARLPPRIRTCYTRHVILREA